MRAMSHKREKRLTRRERKDVQAAAPASHAGHDHDAQHIHCIACGRHLDAHEFDGEDRTALAIRCRHGSLYPCCKPCLDLAKLLVSEHDRTNTPVTPAAAWH